MVYYPYCFSIHRLRYPARLGCYAEERSMRQPVEVDIRLYFPEVPACVGDDDAPFLDYFGVCDGIREQVEVREFRLVEYMAGEFFKSVRRYVDGHGYQDVRIWLRVTKCKPPVPYLEEGASVVVSDLPEGARLIASQ